MRTIELKNLFFQVKGEAGAVSIDTQVQSGPVALTWTQHALQWHLEITHHKIMEHHFQVVSVDVTPQTSLVFDRVMLTLDTEEYQTCFINGYQTWTESCMKNQKRNRKSLNPIGKLYRLNRYGDYDFSKFSPDQSHHYTYIENEDQTISFIGSVDETNGYTLIRSTGKSHSFEIEKELEGKIFENKRANVFKLLIIEASEETVFDLYQTFFPRNRQSKGKITGWTSWYHYYTGITEENILENLEALNKCEQKVDVFQIDDGYQQAVGDWLLINDKFPRGMKIIADQAIEYGFTPGLWLAPFICEKNSKLFSEHPDWVLRDAKGKLVSAGWNPGWSGVFYALDFYNEEFRTYLREVFDTVVNTWRFKLLKLDFLYGIAVIPHHGKSRGEIMCEAMAFLDEISQDAMILGCGVPMAPAFGHVNYCRIGSDVAPYWEDSKLKWIHYQERVSTVNSLLSTVGRRHLDHRFFGNDPDVFILRDGVAMSLKEKYTLFIMNHLFGSLVFTSDLVSTYDESMNALYQKTFEDKPIIEQVQTVARVQIITSKVNDERRLTLVNLTDVSQIMKPDWFLEFEGYSLNPFYNEVEQNTSELHVMKPHETKQFSLIKQ